MGGVKSQKVDEQRKLKREKKTVSSKSHSDVGP